MVPCTTYVPILHPTAPRTQEVQIDKRMYVLLHALRYFSSYLKSYVRGILWDRKWANASQVLLDVLRTVREVVLAITEILITYSNIIMGRANVRLERRTHDHSYTHVRSSTRRTRRYVTQNNIKERNFNCEKVWEEFFNPEHGVFKIMIIHSTQSWWKIPWCYYL